LEWIVLDNNPETGKGPSPEDVARFESQLQEYFPPVVARDSLRLHVLPVPAKACVINTGEIFEARYTRVEHLSGVHRLGIHEEIKTDAPNRLEIAITDDSGVVHVMELPEPPSSNLLRYLIEGPPAQLSFPFECSAFMHYLMGVPFTPGAIFENDWDIRDFDSEEEVSLGQVVLIGDPDFKTTAGRKAGFTSIEDGKHWAMHIGHDWYLSKLGLGGLIVSTVSDLQTGFGGSFVWALRSKW
jgi:hypothetical protein